METTIAPSPLWHDETLGQTFRRGDLEALARSTYDAALDALERGEHAAAAELVTYTVEEALEPQEAFTEWSRLLPDFMRRHGLDPAVVDAEEARLGALIRHPDGSDFDFASGWAKHLALVEAAAALCRAGDAEAAAGAIEAARSHWRADHDRKCDWVCELIAAAARHLGEEVVVVFWDEAMSVWYPNYRRFALESQDWDLSRRQLVDMGILALRGHLTGPGRRGAIAIRDEGDCIALEFAPCGSGGRTFDPDAEGGPTRYEAPYAHAIVEGRHDWAWNRPGVCLYCTHCCRLGQQKAIETLGYPARVVSPPVWPRDRGRAVCTWRIYKHPSLVPETAYAEVGARRPAAFEEEKP